VGHGRFLVCTWATMVGHDATELLIGDAEEDETNAVDPEMRGDANNAQRSVSELQAGAGRQAKGPSSGRAECFYLTSPFIEPATKIAKFFNVSLRHLRSPTVSKQSCKLLDFAGRSRGLENSEDLPNL
jgi:hypothetical protein